MFMQGTLKSSKSLHKTLVSESLTVCIQDKQNKVKEIEVMALKLRNKSNVADRIYSLNTRHITSL